MRRKRSPACSADEKERGTENGVRVQNIKSGEETYVDTKRGSAPTGGHTHTICVTVVAVLLTIVSPVMTHWVSLVTGISAATCPISTPATAEREKTANVAVQ